jgi:hypothetical protein
LIPIPIPILDLDLNPDPYPQSQSLHLSISILDLNSYLRSGSQSQSLSSILIPLFTFDLDLNLYPNLFPQFRFPPSISIPMLNLTIPISIIDLYLDPQYQSPFLNSILYPDSLPQSRSGFHPRSRFLTLISRYESLSAILISILDSDPYSSSRSSVPIPTSILIPVSIPIFNLNPRFRSVSLILIPILILYLDPYPRSLPRFLSLVSISALDRDPDPDLFSQY